MSNILEREKVSNCNKERVLFIGREKCPLTAKALNHLKTLDFNVTVVYSRNRNDLLPENVCSWEGEYIFCFRSLFILHRSILDRATVAAVNFHPGSPEYPGSGCLNYALYESASTYGVTAHIMDEKIDNGKILEARWFPINKLDTVDTLLERTHIKLLDLFFDITIGFSCSGKSYLNNRLEHSKKVLWGGKKRKIKELDALSIIDKDISEIDLAKVIRATYTEMYPPRVYLHGYEFVLKLKDI